MEIKRYIPILGMASAILLSSCVKDTLYNTPHPDKGAVAVSLQDPKPGDNYVVDIDGQNADMVSTIFTYPYLLSPGTYSLIVYNKAEGFTFDGRTAYVNHLSDQSRADGTTVIPLPDYLKTVCREITVTADDTLHINPLPVQRVRDLHFELEVTEGRPELIQSVTGTLIGIAGAFDMEKEQTTGEPVSTAFQFTRDESKLTADIRLLGPMGAVQTLVLDIVFTDGGRTQHTEVDMTEALADFNRDMTTGYQVKGTLETPIGMEEGSGSINDWKDNDGSNVDVE